MKQADLAGPTTSIKPVRVGVFDGVVDADRAIERLVAAGFHKDQITVICPQCSVEKYSEYHKEKTAGERTPAAAAGGGAIGLVLGGLVALAGISATGGLGLLVAGPLVAGAAGGAVAGGFIGAMMTRGFEHEVADFYDQALQKGKVLVSVEEDGQNTPADLALAERIFAESGAETVALPVKG